MNTDKERNRSELDKMVEAILAGTKPPEGGDELPGSDTEPIAAEQPVKEDTVSESTSSYMAPYRSPTDTIPKEIAVGMSMINALRLLAISCSTS